MASSLYSKREGIEVGVWVGFKCDIEQSGQIIKIEKSPWGHGRILTLENKNGFDGHYIGGQTITTIDEQDVWLD